MDADVIVPLLVMAPMAAAFILPLLSRLAGKRFIDYYFITVSLTVFFLAFMIMLDSRDIVYYYFSGWPPPIGIAYALTHVNKLLLFYSSLVFFLTSTYTLWYARHYDNRYLLYTMILGLQAGFNGVLLTRDLFNLYVMLEVSGISAYVLVAYYNDRFKAIVSSLKYSITGIVFLNFFLLGVLFVYVDTRILYLDLLYEKLLEPNMYILVSLVFFTWTSLFLSAILPNHFWLPDAHADAPSPVSALLSGIIVVNGAIVFLKTTTIYNGLIENVSLVLSYLLPISALYSAFMMATSNDVKRILAYSTIVNTSLAFMGLNLGDPNGVSAGLLHLLTHMIGKALAFLSIGVFVHETKTRNIYALEGYGRMYPLALLTFTAGALSLTGLPPFAGFFSKLYLYQSLIMAGQHVQALIIILVSATALYAYMRIIEHLWHTPIHEHVIPRKHLSPKATLTLLALTTILIILGVMVENLVEAFKNLP